MDQKQILKQMIMMNAQEQNKLLLNLILHQSPDLPWARAGAAPV